MTDTARNAALIIIGNEILSGRTKDANTAYIGEKMAEKGVPLREVRVIPDIESIIIDTVNEMRVNFTYVFTTGGIGPTHDDITAASVAKAFDTPIEQNKEAYDILLKHYGEEDLTEARLRMAQIPVGASLIENPVSAAPGFAIENVHVMAGVPRIMQGMLENVLAEMQEGAPIVSLTITCDLPESAIAVGIGQIQKQYPEIDIGSYPYFNLDNTGVSFVCRHTEQDVLDQVGEKIRALILKNGGALKDV